MAFLATPTAPSMFGTICPARISEMFPKTNDTNVVFESSDRVSFHINRVNLETHSSGFPPSGIAVTSGDVVKLSETSKTLELLFAFASPQRCPDLTKVAFHVLWDLAEAAEKYQVYSAMCVANIYMSTAHKQHPWPVLCYAAKHGYPELQTKSAPLAIASVPLEVFRYAGNHGHTALMKQAMPKAMESHPLDVLKYMDTKGHDLLVRQAAKNALTNSPIHVLECAVRRNYTDLVDKAAPHTAWTPASQALDCLPPSLFRIWALYQNVWSQILRNLDIPGAHKLVSFGGVPVDCGDWQKACYVVTSKLLAEPGSLQDPKKLFKLISIGAFGCRQCASALDNWQDRIQERVTKIPKFSQFITANSTSPKPGASSFAAFLASIQTSSA